MFIQSVRHAVRGIIAAIMREENFRIELLCAWLVLLFAFFFHLSIIDWAFLMSVITVVLTLELVNSAVEQMLDVVKPRLHGQVKLIKDMLAGAVLVAILGACAVGLVVFFPHVVEAVAAI